ncbi:hypothetical protein O3M35_006668 [Rhynocoris fuscipes]|uniref:Uncharacterized protein n=1 Tax=Rhynocoris fuscipes TaxID=488301 RepID=A0AAW1DFZ0_9HEMI
MWHFQFKLQSRCPHPETLQPLFKISQTFIYFTHCHTAIVASCRQCCIIRIENETFRFIIAQINAVYYKHQRPQN